MMSHKGVLLPPPPLSTIGLILEFETRKSEQKYTTGVFNTSPPPPHDRPALPRRGVSVNIQGTIGAIESIRCRCGIHNAVG